MLLHGGAAFSFWSFRWVRARLGGESRTNRRHSRAVRGLHFAVRLFTQHSITLVVRFFHIAFFRKTLNLGLTFTLIYGYNISVKVGDSYVF